MDALAQEFAGQAHFLFIYVREAHPDRFPDHLAHRSLEQKLRHAHDLEAKFKTPRVILIDLLDGDVHRLWGGLPNMSWLIDHTGRVAFKGAWTSATDLRQALEAAIRLRDLKRGGSGSAYYTETISFVSEEWGRQKQPAGRASVPATAGVPATPAGDGASPVAHPAPG